MVLHPILYPSDSSLALQGSYKQVFSIVTSHLLPPIRYVGPVRVQKLFCIANAAHVEGGLVGIFGQLHSCHRDAERFHRALDICAQDAKSYIMVDVSRYDVHVCYR